MTLGDPRLAAAIQAVAAGDDEGARQELYEVLRDCQLVLAVRGTEPVLATGEDQRSYVVAFTDVAAMRSAFPADYEPRVTPAATVCQLILAGDSAGLALNPAGPVGGILTRDDVAAIAGTT